MAITPTTGASASLAVTATSLAFAAATQTNGQTYVICISIAGTATVSSISDGTNTFTFRSGITNGTSVRSEIWTMPVTGTTASRTITINFSGSTLASASYEEYAGPTAIGHIGTPATGTGTPAGSAVTTQDNGSYSVTSISVLTNSGDTFAANLGTIRQSVIPALTTSATALVDSTAAYITSSPDDIVLSNQTRLWASVCIELRTGVAPQTVTPENNPARNVKSANNYQVVKSPFLIIGNSPVLYAQNLAGGTTGFAYSETFTVVNGASPYTFSITAGALPTGTSLGSSSGIISGTPSAIGTFNFTVKVIDANGNSGSQAFQIIINSPNAPVPVAANLAGGTPGVAYSETFTASGGTAPYTFAVTGGALPTGTSLNSSTGVISGTPTVAGTYNFTITATDANSVTGSQGFQIIIASPASGGSFTYAG